MQINKNTFDPAQLSFADCDFLLAHAGEAPIVALRSLPPIANRVTMTQWIERFYELEEQYKHRGTEWAGIEAVKQSIETYLGQRAKWSADAAVGAPKFPSMYAFDSRGNGHYSGPGSDSGTVHTYFDETGKRHAFALSLVDGQAQGKWKPSWVSQPDADAAPKQAHKVMSIQDVEGKNAMECGVPGCGHTETFKPDVRSSRAAARARMSRHLRKSTSEQQAHLELHTLEFGS